MQVQVSERARTAWSSLPTTAQGRLNFAFEATWLVGLVLVAFLYNGNNYLFFFTQPKQYVVHLIGITFSVLWLFELALNWRPGVVKSSQPSVALWRRPVAWAGRDPSRWLLIFVGLFGVGQVLSALFSQSTSTSILGRHPNDPGYEAYSAIAYLIALTSIALKMRTLDQVIRFLRVVVLIATATALYGVLQFYGWDPFGFGDVLAFNGTRIFSTYGNPIFFGSVMVMTLPLTITWALLEAKKGRYWIFAIAALSVGLQVSGVWFTSSRGPIFSIAVAVIVIFAACFFLCNRKTFYKLVGIALGAVAFSLLLILAVTSVLTNSGESAEVAAGSRVLTRLVSVVETGDVNSFSTGRLDIWRGAFELLVSRESVPAEEGFLIKTIRHIFGYGQERFFLIYPLTATPKSDFASASHAHNFPLQIWLEAGLWGLISFIGITISTAWVLVNLSIKSWKDRTKPSPSFWLSILTAGLWATLLARAAEQMPGVGRSSDLLLFWMLLGLTVAVYRVSTYDYASLQQSYRVAQTKIPIGRSRGKRNNRRKNPSRGNRNYDPKPILMAIAILAAISGTVAFVVVDVNPIRGSVLAIKAANKLRCPDTRDRAQFLPNMGMAVEYSPKTEEFAVRYAEQSLSIANSAMDQWRSAENSNKSALADTVNDWLERGREPIENYLEEVPYSHNALIWRLRYLQTNLNWLIALESATENESDRGEIAQEIETVRLEYLELLEELSDYFSPFSSVLALLITNYRDLDDGPNEELELARQVLDIPGAEIREKAIAYDVISKAAFNRGDFDTGIENLELQLAVTRNTKILNRSSTYTTLAEVYHRSDRLTEAVDAYTAAADAHPDQSSGRVRSIKVSRYDIEEFLFLNGLDELVTAVRELSSEGGDELFNARDALAQSRTQSSDRWENLVAVEMQLDLLIESSSSGQEYYDTATALRDDLEALQVSWASFNEVPIDAEIPTETAPSEVPAEPADLVDEPSDTETTPETLVDCDF